MKIIEIRNKTTDQLINMLTDLKKESFNLRFQKSYGQLSNTAKVNTIRKMIAKVKTILREQSKLGEKTNA